MFGGGDWFWDNEFIGCNCVKWYGNCVIRWKRVSVSVVGGVLYGKW